MNSNKDQILEFLKALTISIDGPDTSLLNMSSLGLKVMGLSFDHLKNPMTLEDVAQRLATLIKQDRENLEAQHRDDLDFRASLEALRSM